MEDLGEWITAAVPGTDNTVDIVAETQALLVDYGMRAERRGHDLHLEALGLTLSPRGVSAHMTEGAQMQTASIVRVTHPKIMPAGLFEFQHGTGIDLRDALRHGLDQWAQIDLPVLCDACREAPATCSVLKMTYPAKDGRPERVRRAILGPILHFVKRADSDAGQPDSEEEHPFCPCCMTTNCMDAFKRLFEADGTMGVRLYALRDESGQASADCRVNGEDFEQGMTALRAYAEAWPRRGFEIRKQYVLFQSEV